MTHCFLLCLIVNNLFKCVLAVCVSSVWNCLSISFAHLDTRLLILICKDSLYISMLRSLPETYFIENFLQLIVNTDFNILNHIQELFVITQ